MTAKLIDREPTNEMCRVGYNETTTIARWKAMFDAAPEVNPWVSVKERLPKKTGTYLIMNKYNGLIESARFLLRDPVSHKPRISSEASHWWGESILPIPRPK